MRDELAGSRIDTGAVLAGVGLGIVAAAVFGLVTGLLLWKVPITVGWLRWLSLGLRAAVGVVGGVKAGRRAHGNGLVHGLLTGMVLVAVLGILDAVVGDLPRSQDLLLSGGVLLAGAVVGGILGVNLRR